MGGINWFWPFWITYWLGAMTYFMFLEDIIIPKQDLSRAIKLGFAIFWVPILIGVMIYVVVDSWFRARS